MSQKCTGLAAEKPEDDPELTGYVAQTKRSSTYKEDETMPIHTAPLRSTTSHRIRQRYRTREDALTTYMQKVQRIDGFLTRLRGACDDHFHAGPEEVHWGHVGHVTEIERALRALTDRVFNEGEHARE